MSLQVSAIATKPQYATSGHVLVRHTTKFHPCIWGDRFLSFDTNSMEVDDKTKQQVSDLKEEVRRMLIDDDHHKPSQKLYLIDNVQRLGVAYHFDTEIENELRKIHNNNHDDWSSDLYTVALQFRLLRQQGYRVSCGVFKKFMKDKGEFEKSLVSDARGMLGLYEATHMSVHGEELLDQALAFTTTNLKSWLESESVSAPLAAQVSHALKQTLHKGTPRLEHRYYIDTYQKDPSHNVLLLTLAKQDFNIVQRVHLKELSEFTRWWKDLDFKTKLPYARDRLAETYLWIMSVFYEPHYVLGRRLATKVLSMVSLLDDTFDNYGTIEELEIFTKAIERWDIAVLDQLPDYMQDLYVAILDVYREIEELMACQGKSWAVNYAEEAMKELVRAFLQEAKWLNKDYTPKLEEYLSVSTVSCTYPLILTICFLGMGEFATKDAFEWLLTYPKSVMGCCIVCRLMDDIVGHEFEQKRGHVASSVECYMKEHGVEEQDAVNELNKRVMDAWKDMNEECLLPRPVPMPLLTRILNLSRIMDEFYKYDDAYTNSDILLKDFVTAMFVVRAPI